MATMTLLHETSGSGHLARRFGWSSRPRACGGALVELDEGVAWSAPVPPGAIVTCERGTLWVTFEGDSTDYVLEERASFTAPRHGRVAARALERGAVSLELPVR